MQKLVIFGLIKSFHDLFTAFWIGGLLTTALVFMPAIKKGGKLEKTGEILKGYQQRLGTVVLISILGLWITGLFLGRQSAAYGGFMNFSTPYNVLISLKHVIIFLMIIIALVRRYVLGRQLGHFNPKQQKLYAGLLIANTVFGVVVVFLSGIGAAFG